MVLLLGSPLVAEITFYKAGLSNASPVGSGLEEFKEFTQKWGWDWEEDTGNTRCQLSVKFWRQDVRG